MTSEHYDKVTAELGLKDSLPEGCHALIGGAGPDGSRGETSWCGRVPARQTVHGHSAAAGDGASRRHTYLGPPTVWEAHDLILRH
jgi:hypothetical protein